MNGSLRLMRIVSLVAIAFGLVAFAGGCSEILLAKISSLTTGVQQAKEVADAARNIGVPFAGEASMGIGLVAILLAAAQRFMTTKLEKSVQGAHDRVSGKSDEIKELRLELVKLQASNGNGAPTTPPGTSL